MCLRSLRERVNIPNVEPRKNPHKTLRPADVGLDRLVGGGGWRGGEQSEDTFRGNVAAHLRFCTPQPRRVGWEGYVTRALFFFFHVLLAESRHASPRALGFLKTP